MLAQVLLRSVSTHRVCSGRNVKKQWIRVLVTAAVVVGYLAALRYLVPSRDPYFLLAVAVTGSVSWLLGITAGLISIPLLTYLTLAIYGQFESSISYSVFAYSPAYIALEMVTAIAVGGLRKRIRRLTRRERMLSSANETLQSKLSDVREMGGIHSLCSSCKSILDDDGSWKKIDHYLKDKTKAEFSHGLCPDCAADYSRSAASIRSGEPPSSEEGLSQAV